MTTKPHLSFAIASEAPIGVVIASYAARHSQMYLWNTDTDEFTAGQFLKGRSYVQSISADGVYVAYSADTLSRRVWSFHAVSKPPYYTALAFFPTHHLWPGTSASVGMNSTFFPIETMALPGRNRPLASWNICTRTLESILDARFRSSGDPDTPRETGTLNRTTGILEQSWRSAGTFSGSPSQILNPSYWLHVRDRPTKGSPLLIGRRSGEAGITLRLVNRSIIG